MIFDYARCGHHHYQTMTIQLKASDDNPRNYNDIYVPLSINTAQFHRFAMYPILPSAQ